MKPMEARFWEKVDFGDVVSCWEWTAGKTTTGYGMFKIDGERRRAHRVAWLLTYGQWPRKGMTIDHLCRNRACVRVDHMEIVSQGVNALRGVGPCAINARKGVCLKGHPYDAVKINGGRFCTACRREYTREHMRRYRKMKKLTGRVDRAATHSVETTSPDGQVPNTSHPACQPGDK